MNYRLIIATSLLTCFCISPIPLLMAQDEGKQKERKHFVDLRVVYTKTRDVRIIPLPGSTIECRCPDGTHSAWRVWNETDNTFGVLDRGCGGIVDKSSVYTQKELDAIDLSNRKPTETSWIRLCIATSSLIDQRFEQSIEQCDSIIDQEPKNSTALLIRAYAKIETQAYNSALLDISLAEDINNNLYEIPVLRGRALYKKGKFEEALFHFAIAYSMKSQDHEILLLRALCNISLGRKVEALDDLVDIHLFNPVMHFTALRLRSELLIDLDMDKPDYDYAIKDYEYMRENGDDNLNLSLINMAFIHAARSDTESRKPKLALELLEQFRNRPDHAFYEFEYRMAKCLAHMASEQYEKADFEMKMLKKMYIGDFDYIEFDRIEKSLKDRVQFIHKKEFPLIRLIPEP